MRFSFFCMFRFDVYLKKQLIENLIDAKLAGNNSQKMASSKKKKPDKSENTQKKE